MRGPQVEVLAASVNELNDSGVSGRVIVIRKGDTLRVHVHLRGLEPGLPHLMHLHDGGECPPPSATGNGLLSLLDGAAYYGMTRVPFTDTGPSEPGVILAIDRYPVADRHGRIVLNRFLTLPDDVDPEALDDYSFVVHGLELNDTPGYQAPPVSPLVDALATMGLTPADLGWPPERGPLPQEVTVPVGCGALDARK